jgi:hypothetical protein
MIRPFPCIYDVDENVELPSGGKRIVYYYPGARTDGGKDGLILGLSPAKGLKWVGCFESGYRSNVALTEISSCPNENEICVVSSGTAYVVRVDNPLAWQTMPCYPVTQLVPAPEHGLLVFSDFTKLAAVGLGGVRWVTARLATDTLKIVGINGNIMRVAGWKAEDDFNVETEIDLLTGETLQAP